MATKVPSTEYVWMTRIVNEHLRYHITSKGGDRSVYYIYENRDGVITKLGKAESPKELEERYVKGA